MAAKKLLVVGLFLRSKGVVPAQGMELANLLKKNGYEVITVSHIKNRVARLLHTLYFIIKNRNKFDTALVQVYSGLSFYWQLISGVLIKSMNKKLVLTIHGGGVPAAMKKNTKAHMTLFNKADLITCPSNFIVSTLKDYGVSSLLVENVIRLDKFPFHPKESIRPTLFWMRALSPIYNPEMVVEVIRQLKYEYKYENIKLYIAGPNMGLKKRIEELINNYNLTDNIELVGFVNDDEKLKYAEICDVYLCTNRVDNAPVSFIEMLSLGLPIVSTNVGGIPYIVKDNETALLVDSEDYKAMAEKVNYLISNPEVGKRLAANGRQIADVNRYSEEGVYNKWKTLLDNL